ncbi:MAG: MBL fold metallo-hydrolase [Verrucomicrobiota bacterium]
MKVILGGVRGTSCMSQPEYMRYGGDTTSVLVKGERGERVIIDAGTGVRRLGQVLEAEGADRPMLMLFTHYHLDHVIGLPSLSLLYRNEAKFEIASPPRGGHTAKEVLSQLIAQPYWPVQLEELHAALDFLPWADEASKDPYPFGKLAVRWCPVHHPGGCTAYRIDEPETGRSFVFATDVEWTLSTPAEREAFLRLCREPAPPSLLVFDGQFSRENYARFVGWGHSAWEDAVDAARAVKAKLLLVTHHAPQNNDERLERLDAQMTRELSDVKLARDGMEIVL